jgi:hypothetical protein
MHRKKIVAALSALVLIASTASVVSILTAAETEGLTATMSTATVKAGEEFSLDITLEDVPAGGISAIDFSITYDEDLIDISSIEEGPISKTGASEREQDLANEAGVPDLGGSMFNPAGGYSCLDYVLSDGLTTVTWATGLLDVSESEYWISENGVLLTIKGTVSEDAPAGMIPFEIVPTERESAPGSGSSNTEIVFAAVGVVDADNKEYTTVPYDVVIVDGGVEVEGEGGTTTTLPGSEDPGTTTTPGSEDPGTTTLPGEDLPSITVKGDVDSNGAVELLDLVLICKHVVGVTGSALEGQNLANSDCNENGNTDSDADDAVQLAKYLVKSISEDDWNDPLYWNPAE